MICVYVVYLSNVQFPNELFREKQNRGKRWTPGEWTPRGQYLMLFTHIREKTRIVRPLFSVYLFRITKQLPDLIFQN